MKKSWLERYIQLSFMCVCKSVKNRWIEWETFQGCVKTKKEKKNHMKILSFITQFKIEYLLMFIGCRKGLGEMSD